MRIDCEEILGLMAGIAVENDTNGGLPTTQAVLNFIALKYFRAVDPTNPEELNGYLKYLTDVRKVLLVDTQQGSLIITVECCSLEILEGLWEDYCSGHLNEMAQKYLVTDDVLKEFGLIKVTLATTILAEEYSACRKYFLKITGESENLFQFYTQKIRLYSFPPGELKREREKRIRGESWPSVHARKYGILRVFL